MDMNADTQNKLEQIRRDGYWRTGTCLGDGGWAAVMQFAAEWKTYKLLEDSPLAGDGAIDGVTARDDAAAIAAFQSLYRSLNGLMIVEEVITRREIPIPGKPEDTHADR